MREADFFADCGSPEIFNGRETVTGDTLKHISIILLQKLLQLTSGVQGNAVCKAADAVGDGVAGEMQIFGDGFIGCALQNVTDDSQIGFIADADHLFQLGKGLYLVIVIKAGIILQLMLIMTFS